MRKAFREGSAQLCHCCSDVEKMSSMLRPLDLLYGDIEALDKWGLGRVGTKAVLKWVQERV